MKESLQLQLFIGCHITSELRLNLSLNQDWQRDKMFCTHETPALKEVRYQDKEYIGLPITNSSVSLAQIPKHTQFIQDKLTQYCPDLNSENLKLSIFPQIFLC